MSTADLDAVGREVLDRHGARPAPPTVGFPAATCVSVNHEAAHGIPSPTGSSPMATSSTSTCRPSCTATGPTPVPALPSARCRHIARRLLEATRLANRDGLAAARAGEPLRHIGRAVQRRARRYGFSVIQNLNGHGTGRNLWETPSVPGYEDPRDRTRLWEGLVLAIEPFLSTGATWADEAADGWTLVTPGHLTAQFEHTVVVTHGRPLILTA